MTSIDLKIGSGSFTFEYDPQRFDVLAAEGSSAPLTDAQINQRIEQPIDTPPLEELVEPGETVLICVPDATRSTGAGQIVNLIVRRLIANGTAPGDISIIFATGIHRKVTDEEKTSIVTPFIAQRIKLLDHDPRDLAQLVHVGETSGGIRVELNRAVVESGKVILVGGVSFHYFAGFTGGRKLVCPGLASARTVAATHKLAFDCETLSRREGVDTGLLDGNAVHEAFIEAVKFVDPAFAVNTIVNDAGDVVDLTCGHWNSSHRAAVEKYSSDHTVEITEKRDLVVASCGGSPHDINMIQAHKTMDAASRACNEGGTLLILAECADGLGRDDFLSWFDVADSGELAKRLCEKYQVNGQTAWNLLRLAETININIVADLPEDVIAKMRLKRIMPDAAAQMIKAATTSGFIIPDGAKLNIRG